MNENKDLMQHAYRLFPVPQAPFEKLLRRRDRKRRNQRIGAAAIAIALALVAFGGLVKAFRGGGGGELPASPPITARNLGTLHLAWKADASGTPVVSGGHVYAYSADGRTLQAFPEACGTAGATCTPNWTWRSPTPTGSPMVADGKVFVEARDTLYALPENCGTGGATCQPSWKAWTGLDVSIVGVADGKVFVQHYGVKIMSFPVSCGSGASTCNPLWLKEGDVSLAVSSGFAFESTFTFRGELAVYPVSCYGGGTACVPSWRAIVGVNSTLSVDEVTDGIVYVQQEHPSSLLAFPTSCSPDKYGFCEHLWSVPGFELAGVAGGVAYVKSFSAFSHGFGVAAYDPTCGRTRKACAPLWKAWSSQVLQGVAHACCGSAVVPGVAFVVGGTKAHGTGGIYRYSGSCPTGRTVCKPPRVVRGIDDWGGISASNGIVFAMPFHRPPVAYAASCLISHDNCSPIWSAAKAGLHRAGSPLIVGGWLYVSEGTSLYAFAP